MGVRVAALKFVWALKASSPEMLRYWLIRVGTWALIDHLTSAPTTLHHLKTSNYSVLTTLIPTTFPLHWLQVFIVNKPSMYLYLSISSLGLLCCVLLVKVIVLVSPTIPLTLLPVLEINYTKCSRYASIDDS